jgi:hypothetical protein
MVNKDSKKIPSYCHIFLEKNKDSETIKGYYKNIEKVIDSSAGVRDYHLLSEHICVGLNNQENAFKLMKELYQLPYVTNIDLIKPIMWK